MKKIIINTAMALLFIALISGSIIIREIKVYDTMDHSTWGWGVLVYSLSIPFIFLHYAVLWRGVYHILTDKPHKILYTVVDVISIVSMAFTTNIMIGEGIFYGSAFIPNNEQTWWPLWLPFAFLAVRALCLIGYKIAERRKKPLLADDS